MRLSPWLQHRGDTSYTTVMSSDMAVCTHFSSSDLALKLRGYTLSEETGNRLSSSFQEKVWNCGLILCCNFLFPHPLQFSSKSSQISVNYFSLLSLERPCLCMMYHRDAPAVAAEPSTCVVRYSTWSLAHFTRKSFLKNYTLHLLLSQIHLEMSQKLWTCCCSIYSSALIMYPISEEHLSRLGELTFLHWNELLSRNKIEQPAAY